MDLGAISLFISLGALILSFVALWKTHLAKFSIVTTVGDLRQRLFPIRSGKKRWFLFIFDLPVSITNSGARPGRVLGMRLKLHYPEVPIQDNHEYLYVAREVDPIKSGLLERDYFKWLDQMTLGGWAPFTVLPGRAISKHLHFQARWDKPVYQDKCICDLEVFIDSSSDWLHVARWKIILSKLIWSELFTKGNTISFQAEGSPQKHRDIVPPDLYEYISKEESIPEGGFGAESSYVDWPEHLLEEGNNNDAA